MYVVRTVILVACLHSWLFIASAKPNELLQQDNAFYLSAKINDLLVKIKSKSVEEIEGEAILSGSDTLVLALNSDFWSELKLLGGISESQFDKYSSLAKELADSTTDFLASVSTDSESSFGSIEPALTIDAATDPTSTIIAGAASFIETRFRRSMTDMLLDQVRRELDKPPLDTLLEETSKLFEDTYFFDHFTEITSVLQTSLRKDLDNLPANAIHIALDLQKNSGGNANSPLAALLQSANDLFANSNRTRLDPADVFNSLSSNLKNDSSSAAKLVHLLNLFSDNLRNRTGFGWIRESEFQEMLKSPQRAYIFVALLLYYDTHNPRNLPVDCVLTNVRISAGDQDSKRVLLQYLANLHSILEQVQTQLTNLKNPQYPERGEAYWKSIHFAFDAFRETAYILAHESDLKSLKNLHDCKHFLNFLKIPDIIHHIQEKDYSYAFVILMSIYEDYEKSSDLLDSPLPHFSPGAKRVASILTAIAAADSAEQIEQILEATALPYGSHISKRKRYSSYLTINSYAGGVVGKEWIPQISKNSTFSGGEGVTGFTAPIGIEYRVFKARELPVIFLSAVDLGAVVSYRLAEDTTETVDASLQQVFSPGFHLLWGLGNTPLTFGTGIQYTPELREIGGSEMNAMRLHLTITADIPLYILYTRHREDRPGENRSFWDVVTSCGKK